MSEDERRYELPGLVVARNAKCADVSDVESAWADRDAEIIDPAVFARCCDALEYVIRSPRKGGPEDLSKAIVCLEWAYDRWCALAKEARPERVSDLRGVEERIRSAATAADGVLRVPTDRIEQGTR